MAFKEFTNRSVQYPFRRKLTLVAGTTDVYEVTKTGVEGTVFADGVMFNEANMGEMQDEIVNYVEGTVLWTNSSPTSSFAGQTVMLSEAIEGFQFYEIKYANNNVSPQAIVSTGKIPIANRTILSLALENVLFRSLTSAPSTTSFVFGNATSIVYSTGASSTLNTALIPIQIIGYK